jgi:hypothetical protein
MFRPKLKGAIMSDGIDRFIEAQDRERKARKELQEIVDEFLRRPDETDPVFLQSDHPEDHILCITDVPTMSDIRDAVAMATIAASSLQAVTASLTQEERRALRPSSVE